MIGRRLVLYGIYIKKGRFACCAGRRQCVPPSCILYEIWQVCLKSSVVKEKKEKRKEKVKKSVDKFKTV